MISGVRRLSAAGNGDLGPPMRLRAIGLATTALNSPRSARLNGYSFAFGYPRFAGRKFFRESGGSWEVALTRGRYGPLWRDLMGAGLNEGAVGIARRSHRKGAVRRGEDRLGLEGGCEDRHAADRTSDRLQDRTAPRLGTGVRNVVERPMSAARGGREAVAVLSGAARER
jgi:hypothetical protein